MQAIVVGLWMASIVAVQARADPRDTLVRSYPQHLARIEGNEVVWIDGTRMPVRRHPAGRSRSAVIADPDIADMTVDRYPTGRIEPPLGGADPGRARPSAFFDKMYGSCTRGEVARHLRDVRWPGPSGPHRIRVTSINGVAERLAAVSAEVARLPAPLRGQLVPPAGGYACRQIAGTSRGSPHGWGIAVDIATAVADYWRWETGAREGAPGPWRNRIAPEVVAIFEKHGFIWGGRWSHFDTMHFEYRPELLPPTIAPR